MKELRHIRRGAKKNEQGYILLLTILVISILLGIGLGINTISIKETMLSSYLRDSEKALAAADRGVECVLFWDRTPSGANPQFGSDGSSLINGSIFASTSVAQFPANYTLASCHNGTANINLAQIPWAVTTVVGPPSSATTKFNLQFSDGTCVDVTVTKVGDESTTITGDGYNTCTVNMTRRTQREISVFTNI